MASQDKAADIAGSATYETSRYSLVDHVVASTNQAPSLPADYPQGSGERRLQPSAQLPAPSGRTGLIQPS